MKILIFVTVHSFPADDAPQELSKAGVTPYSYEGEAEEKAAAKQIEICSKCIKTETERQSGRALWYTA